MSFVNELKRRNVFRVAIAYVVTAWLIAQVAGLAADSFGAPDWVMKMLITLLMLGAPVALLMAWAYELTPDGLKRDSGDQTARSSTGKLDRTIIIALVAALGYFAFDKFVLDPKRDAALLKAAVQQPAAQSPAVEPQVSTAEQTETSVAVLSFVNMSDDASNEYFSDGLSEELLNLLVKIPELRVAARTSSFSFKDKDVKIAQIAKELNVTHVLEGSVRKADNQIRVTAQLIHAEEGYHLWSETFDRQLDDIFEVQDEIATAVVSALKISLLGDIPEPRKTDPEAYALYLQGVQFNRTRSSEDLEKSIEVLTRTLEIDPNYAEAWVAIAYAQGLLNDWYDDSYDSNNQLQLESLNRALAIDENLAAAWASLAYHKRSVNWDWTGAQEAIDRAIQLEPNNADVIGISASIASTFGQLDKSLGLFEQNVALDPFRYSSQRALANRYNSVGRFEDALRTFELVQELNPEYPGITGDIAYAHLAKGNPERALELLESMDDSSRVLAGKAISYFQLGKAEQSQAALDQLLESNTDIQSLRIAMVNAQLGNLDDAFMWLEVAYENHHPGLVFLLIYLNSWSSLTGDPRWPLFLEKLDLREYWEAMPPEYGGPVRQA